MPVKNRTQLIKQKAKKVKNPKTAILNEEFDEKKIVFVETLELLLKACQMCFISGYEKGTIECINMMVRCCCNTMDIPLV